MALKKALIQPALEGELSHHLGYLLAGRRWRVYLCERSTAEQLQGRSLEGIYPSEIKPGLAVRLKSSLFRQRVVGLVPQAGQQTRHRDIFIQSVPVQALSGQFNLLPLLRRCSKQPRKPGQRHGQCAAIAQVDP